MKKRCKRIPFQPKRNTASFADIVTVFSDVDILIDRLKRGEVLTVNDKPVLRTLSGSYSPVVPCLLGWFAAWEEIHLELGTKFNAPNLKELTEKLAANEWLTPELIERCEEEVTRFKQIFLSLDVKVIHRCAMRAINNIEKEEELFVLMHKQLQTNGTKSANE